jgi:hypothetical protein
VHCLCIFSSDIYGVGLANTGYAQLRGDVHAPGKSSRQSFMDLTGGNEAQPNIVF